MKRFYCTVCRKVKRVQKWPWKIDNTTSNLPEQRAGQCDYHTFGRTKHPKKLQPKKLQKRAS